MTRNESNQSRGNTAKRRRGICEPDVRARGHRGGRSFRRDPLRRPSVSHRSATPRNTYYSQRSYAEQKETGEAAGAFADSKLRVFNESGAKTVL